MAQQPIDQQQLGFIDADSVNGEIVGTGTTDIVLRVGGDNVADTIKDTGGVARSVGVGPFNIPILDASGDLSVPVSGVADTALALATPVNIGVSGNASGSISFDGSASVNIPVTLTGGNVDTATTLETSRNISITGPQISAPAISFNGSSNVALAAVLNTSGTWTGNAATASNATLAATATNALACSGNSATATGWLTGRTLTLTGAVTGTSAAFSGTGNITIATTSAIGSSLTFLSPPTLLVSGSTSRNTWTTQNAGVGSGVKQLILSFNCSGFSTSYNDVDAFVMYARPNGTTWTLAQSLVFQAGKYGDTLGTYPIGGQFQVQTDASGNFQWRAPGPNAVLGLTDIYLVAWRNA